MSKPKPLIVEDAHLPRHQRRYPYRAASEREEREIRMEADAVLRSLSGMVTNAVKRFWPIGQRQDEVRAEIVEHLWAKSLPRFDRRSRTKLSSFLCVCIRNKASELARAELRRKYSRRPRDVSFSDSPALARVTFAHDDAHGAMLHAPDELLDDRIVAIAQDVMEHPRAYLTAEQSRVFSAVVFASPGKTMSAIAHELGYLRPSSLSMMMRRIRERIAEIDIEGWEPSVDEKHVMMREAA